MISQFEKDLGQTYAKQMGKQHLILIEKISKRDSQVLVGKTDNFKKGYINKQ